MNIVCLDMEGVLTPEIWIAFAKASGIPQLCRTTRDEPDYDKLMRWRIELLRERGLKLNDIRDVIATIDPLPGAKAFLDRLRALVPTVVLSDTFMEFASPLIKKLDRPLLLCNCLETDGDGFIIAHRMRTTDSKLTTVRAFYGMGYETIAAGDSFNDIDMIRASRAGFLFRASDTVRKANPDLECFQDYDDLYKAIAACL